MTKIKICGIRRLEDAKFAVSQGVDAIGLNFVSQSKRYIEPVSAQALVRQLPPQVSYVGVFVDAAREEVEQVARLVPLDALQFHGNEDPDFCRAWSSWDVIKAFRFKTAADIDLVQDYREVVDYLMFDAFDEQEYGGTGRLIQEDILEELAKQGLLERAYLAGGLNPENVGTAVAKYLPYGVDVASGVESAPGEKDSQLVRAFLRALKS